MGTQNTPNTARYRHQGRGLRGTGVQESWALKSEDLGQHREGGGGTAGEGRAHRQRAEVRDATSNRLHLLRAGGLAEASDTWKLATGITASAFFNFIILLSPWV